MASPTSHPARPTLDAWQESDLLALWVVSATSLALLIGCCLLTGGWTLMGLVAALGMGSMGAFAAGVRGAAAAFTSVLLGLSMPCWVLAAGAAFTTQIPRLEQPLAAVLGVIVIFGIALTLSWWRWWVACFALVAFATAWSVGSLTNWEQALPVAILGLWIPHHLAAMQAIRSRNRTRPGFCPHCLYDCTSLPPATSGFIRCPECGREDAQPLNNPP